jgi:RNA polymerase primary sigma factor
MIMEPTIEELQELSASMPQVETNDILTEEQEKNLILKFQEGDLTALSELLEANIRFVITIAKLYENECYFLEMREK